MEYQKLNICKVNKQELLKLINDHPDEEFVNIKNLDLFKIIVRKKYIKHYKNNKLHREDGPAIELADGKKEWYFEGVLHREDGPAIEHINGDKIWYKQGVPHRLNGPAIECVNGYKVWYINGKIVSPFEGIYV